MAPKKKQATQKVIPTAFHGVTEKGTSVVGIGNIKVIIVKDADMWFAQGLDIDYAVQAKTLPDVKQAFANGLMATVHENLTVYGSIEKLLKPAPPEVWKSFLMETSSAWKGFFHSQLSFHDNIPALPFSGIDFLQHAA